MDHARAKARTRTSSGSFEETRRQRYPVLFLNLGDETEVPDFEVHLGFVVAVPAAVDEHVGGLHVPVEEAFVAKFLKARAHLHKKITPSIVF